MRIRLITVLSMAALAVAPLASSQAGTSAVQVAANHAVSLNFGSGRQGGSQYPVTVAIGQVLQKLPEFKSFSLQPGGSIGNIVRVDTGKSDIAISMSMALADGRQGNSPFKKKVTNVLQLMTLHAFNVIALVPVKSDIKSYKDFAGKKINFAPVGYSIMEVGNRIMKKLGIAGKVKVGHLRINAAVQQFKDGHIAGLFYSPSDRYGPIMNLAQTRDVRAVPLDGWVMDEILKETPSFFRTHFPKTKGVYKRLINSVDTIAFPNVIVASRKRISNSQAYAIVKAVAENFDKVAVGDPSLKDFDPKDMARKVGSPFHPGAIKYYTERGWRK